MVVRLQPDGVVVVGVELHDSCVFPHGDLARYVEAEYRFLQHGARRLVAAVLRPRLVNRLQFDVGRHPPFVAKMVAHLLQLRQREPQSQSLARRLEVAVERDGERLLRAC